MGRKAKVVKPVGRSLVRGGNGRGKRPVSGRSPSFVQVVRRLIEMHKAQEYVAKAHGSKNCKIWTHPNIRPALYRELETRLFRGTKLNSELIEKLAEMPNDAKAIATAFSNGRRVSVEKGWLELIKELRQVRANTGSLLRLSERIIARAKGGKASLWEINAQDALGHMLTPISERANSLRVRLGA